MRAIIFQLIFLLVAIAIEAAILCQRLELDRKTAVQYASTVNLLSVVVGWVIFFIAQPLLPLALREQVISYIFFDRFFDNPWLATTTSLVIVIGFLMFFFTFLLKLQGLELLEWVLGKKDDKPDTRTLDSATTQPRKFRFFEATGTRATVVLLANACSFSAILIIMAVRWLEQSFYPQ